MRRQGGVFSSDGVGRCPRRSVVRAARLTVPDSWHMQPSDQEAEKSQPPGRFEMMKTGKK